MRQARETVNHSFCWSTEFKDKDKAKIVFEDWARVFTNFMVEGMA